MMFREEEELEKPDLGWKEAGKEKQRKKNKNKGSGEAVVDCLTQLIHVWIKIQIKKT